ncbi:MAG: site-specific integrase [Nitrososphaerota archaeon]|nr:site-specific integrase [Nitrososphaerota archaeon]MDG6919362.1 site-specific integrase [Nitrososphaerota archaeon]MDG6946868.1 site-specific integrase [Nitrososphaerota archaeon]
MSPLESGYTKLMVPRAELERDSDLKRALTAIGGSEAAQRYIATYGKVGVKAQNAFRLGRYHRWLREEKGVGLSLDEMIRDNLFCVWKSDPVDVDVKRKHRAWLEEFVNVKLAGCSLSYRRGTASIIKGFYEKNDSPLFGRVRVADSEAQRPPKALSAEEIRAVLKALPLQQRTPLLCMWQSGCEVGRMLSMKWRDLHGLETGKRIKLEFVGRKRHRRAYFTFLGRDSVEALRLWRGRWTELIGREPGPEDLVFLGKYKAPLDRAWLNVSLKRMASRLSAQGLIANGHPGSWHTHYLRHSFKTEAEHSGVKSGFVEYWMGHTEGISWVYDNRDQVHGQDFEEAYTKLEPFISLDENAAVLKDEYDLREKQMLSELLELKRKVNALLSRSGARSEIQSGPANPPAQSN